MFKDSWLILSRLYASYLQWDDPCMNCFFKRPEPVEYVPGWQKLQKSVPWAPESKTISAQAQSAGTLRAKSLLEWLGATQTTSMAQAGKCQPDPVQNFPAWHRMQVAEAEAPAIDQRENIRSRIGQCGVGHNNLPVDVRRPLKTQGGWMNGDPAFLFLRDWSSIFIF